MLLAHFSSDGQTYSFSFFPSLCVCFYVGRTLCILLHAIPIAIATAAGKTDEGGKEAARPPNLLSVDQIWTKWNKLSSTSWKSRASWLRLVKVNSFSAFFISKLYVSSICFCTSLTFECVPFSHLPKGFQFNLPRSVCDCYVFHFFFIAELFFTPHFWRYVFNCDAEKNICFMCSQNFSSQKSMAQRMMREETMPSFLANPCSITHAKKNLLLLTSH